jgi:crossover junction endodeoxyribonuclease RusA
MFRRQWQERVRRAAEAAWPEAALPVGSNCLLIVVYYGEHPVLLDNDNLVKPIQDALNGLVYRDDSQVTDTMIRKTSLYQNFFIEDQSEVLLSALRHRVSFVHVQVDMAPDHRRLL